MLGRTASQGFLVLAFLLEVFFSGSAKGEWTYIFFVISRSLQGLNSTDANGNLKKEEFMDKCSWLRYPHLPPLFLFFFFPCFLNSYSVLIWYILACVCRIVGRIWQKSKYVCSDSDFEKFSVNGNNAKKMRRKKASVNLITRNVFEQDANCEYDQLKFQLYQSIKWEHDVFGLQLPTKGTYKEKITACQNHSTRFIFTKTCIGCQDVELKKQEELESLKA